MKRGVLPPGGGSTITMKLRISPLFFALQKATKPLLCVDRVCRLEGGSCQSLGKGVASGRGRALQRAQTSDGANWKVWEDLGFFHPPENGRINPEKGTISIWNMYIFQALIFRGLFWQSLPDFILLFWEHVLIFTQQREPAFKLSASL